MTCIVGIIHDNKVYIGGDSAGVNDNQISIRSDSKIFKNGDYIIGFTDSFRMGNILRYKFRPPSPPKSQDDLSEFMCTKFVDKLITTFKDNGYGNIDQDGLTGGEFIVGVSGRLFKIGYDFQVGEHLDNYLSVGSGSHYALGSLFSSSSLQPHDRIHLALSAAEYHSPGVRSPFHIIET